MNIKSAFSMFLVGARACVDEEWLLVGCRYEEAEVVKADDASTKEAKALAQIKSRKYLNKWRERWVTSTYSPLLFHHPSNPPPENPPEPSQSQPHMGHLQHHPHHPQHGLAPIPGHHLFIPNGQVQMMPFPVNMPPGMPPPLHMHPHLHPQQQGEGGVMGDDGQQHGEGQPGVPTPGIMPMPLSGPIPLPHSSPTKHRREDDDDSSDSGQGATPNGSSLLLPPR